MGLLDLPAPVFATLDGWLAPLPAWLRIVLWGTAAGLLSMWLYKLVSPQRRISRATEEQSEARRRLDAFDGDLSEAWPLIRRLLGLSFRRVGQVIGPALLASLPVLCVLVWMSTAYGHRYPDAPPQVRVDPSPLDGRWRDGTPPHVLIDGSAGVAPIPLPAPVPIVEKRRWWNVLIGNPAGYLAPGSPVERVLVELPRRDVLPVGPSWLRGWEVPFFVSLLVASLVLKQVLRIH